MDQQPHNPMAALPGQPPQPASPVQPQQPQRQATLEEYASGVNHVNIELQRQSAAYGHFRGVLAQLDAIAQDPQAAHDPLPFVIVRFPQEGPTPGEMKLDMNALPPEMLPHFRPLFECLTVGASKSLVTAWENIHRVTDATRPIIAAAKQTNG